MPGWDISLLFFPKWEIPTHFSLYVASLHNVLYEECPYTFLLYMQRPFAFLIKSSVFIYFSFTKIIAQGYQAGIFLFIEIESLFISLYMQHPYIMLFIKSVLIHFVFTSSIPTHFLLYVASLSISSLHAAFLRISLYKERIYTFLFFFTSSIPTYNSFSSSFSLHNQHPNAFPFTRSILTHYK